MQWYYKEKFYADHSWALKEYTVKNNPNSPNHYPFIFRTLFTFFALFINQWEKTMCYNNNKNSNFMKKQRNTLNIHIACI